MPLLYSSKGRTGGGGGGGGCKQGRFWLWKPLGSVGGREGRGSLFLVEQEVAPHRPSLVFSLLRFLLSSAFAGSRRRSPGKLDRRENGRRLRTLRDRTVVLHARSFQGDVLTFSCNGRARNADWPLARVHTPVVTEPLNPAKKEDPRGGGGGGRKKNKRRDDDDGANGERKRCLFLPC